MNDVAELLRMARSQRAPNLEEMFVHQLLYQGCDCLRPLRVRRVEFELDMADEKPRGDTCYS